MRSRHWSRISILWKSKWKAEVEHSCTEWESKGGRNHPLLHWVLACWPFLCPSNQNLVALEKPNVKVEAGREIETYLINEICDGESEEIREIVNAKDRSICCKLLNFAIHPNPRSGSYARKPMNRHLMSLLNAQSNLWCNTQWFLSACCIRESKKSVISPYMLWVTPFIPGCWQSLYCALSLPSSQSHLSNSYLGLTITWWMRQRSHKGFHGASRSIPWNVIFQGRSLVRNILMKQSYILQRVTTSRSICMRWLLKTWEQKPQRPSIDRQGRMHLW